MPPHDLFPRIVQACELSEVIGTGLVRRSLGDGGHDVETAGVDEWRAVLPHLEKRLQAYMSEAEALERRRRVEALLDAHVQETRSRGSMAPPAPTSPPGISTPNPDA